MNVNKSLPNCSNACNRSPGEAPMGDLSSASPPSLPAYLLRSMNDFDDESAIDTSKYDKFIYSSKTLVNCDEKPRDSRPLLLFNPHYTNIPKRSLVESVIDTSKYDTCIYSSKTLVNCDEKPRDSRPLLLFNPHYTNIPKRSLVDPPLNQSQHKGERQGGSSPRYTLWETDSEDWTALVDEDWTALGDPEEEEAPPVADYVVDDSGSSNSRGALVLSIMRYRRQHEEKGGVPPQQPQTPLQQNDGAHPLSTRDWYNAVRCHEKPRDSRPLLMLSPHYTNIPKRSLVDPSLATTEPCATPVLSQPPLIRSVTEPGNSAQEDSARAQSQDQPTEDLALTAALSASAAVASAAGAALATLAALQTSRQDPSLSAAMNALASAANSAATAANCIATTMAAAAPTSCSTTERQVGSSPRHTLWETDSEDWTALVGEEWTALGDPEEEKAQPVADYNVDDSDSFNSSPPLMLSIMNYRRQQEEKGEVPPQQSQSLLQQNDGPHPLSTRDWYNAVRCQE